MNPLPAPASEPATRSRRWSLGRVFAVGAIVAYFVFGLLFLVVREVVVPRVEQYRPQIESALSYATGLPVSIESLSADWPGLRPRLHLAGVLVRDRDGRPALSLDKVDGVLAWSSLLRGQANFHRLELRGPELALRRDAEGYVFVAGIRLEPRRGEGGFTDWLLAQREIVIRDAALSWLDEQRAAPELRLEAVDFRFLRVGGRYRFGLQAEPPPTLASMLVVRGDLVSTRPGAPDSWAGQLYLALDRADLGGWRPWIDYPVELDGTGGVRAWLGVENGEVGSLATQVVLDDVTTRLGAALPPLRLSGMRGWLSGRWRPSGLELSGRGVEVATADGVRIEGTDFDLSLRGMVEGRPAEGQLSANHLDFTALAAIAAHLPFDPLRARLAEFSPRGRLEDVRLAWRGSADMPDEWRVLARFADLGLNAAGKLPGLSGLSGEIDGDQRGGRFRLAGQDAWLDLPAVFPEQRMAFARLRAEGGWSRHDGRTEIVLESASFENPDAAGVASGRYFPVEDGPGEIDLSARLTRAEGQAVWRYLPRVVGDHTRTWLRNGITAGFVPEARLRLKGNLADFPFREAGTGQFLVTTRVSGARLHYADDWPEIDGIDGELRFEGPAMRIVADRARIFDVNLSGVTVEVPELHSEDGEEIMTIRGKASGPTADFLRFISESPLARRLHGLTGDIEAQGRGNLDLTLVMPLPRVRDTAVKGEFRFAGNRLRVVDGLPPLVDAAGMVRFTENEFVIREARAKVFGEPMALSAEGMKEGGVRFKVSGGANAAAVRQVYDWPWLEHLSGTAAWTAGIDVRDGATKVDIRSDLAGVASSLPQPMNKRAGAAWPLGVVLDFPPGGERLEVRAELEDRAVFELVRRRTAKGWEIERGGLALSAPLGTAPGGLSFNARLDELDVDAWRRVFEQEDEGREPSARAALPLAALSLDVGQVKAFGQTFAGVRLTAQAGSGGGWTGSIASREAEGSFDWHGQEDGALHARLARLQLGSADERREPASSQGAEPEPPRRLPALDIVADEFSLHGMALGRLELQARNQNGVWHLNSLALAHRDGRIAGTGRWRPGENAVTELDFRVEADNIGRFLNRLGYPDAVVGGRAELTGNVDWHGAPTRIHYPSLSGLLKLEAREGQFRKLDPGVGRLLGVLSLQALPRRLTLDFRDVFSEGFAFDRISGSIEVASGVMRTEDLQIRGPSARVLMTGSADLDKETQDLRVTVQPTLSESVAIGAAAGLINPVAGVVTYFAQKALSDPIERLFAFTYEVTGTWADPRVEKVAPAQQPAESPAESGR